jgi:PAS domain S-box
MHPHPLLLPLPGVAGIHAARMDGNRVEQGRNPPIRVIGLGNAAGMLAVMVILALLWSRSYLLFHTLAELFSVVVAFAVFVVTWYSRDWIGRNYLLLIGVGQLFVGGVDVLHTVTYRGVGILDVGADPPTQLWLAARGLEAATFLVAVWSPHLRWRGRIVLPAFAAIAAILVAAVFTGWFPRAYAEGTGVTPFKVVTEVAVCLAFVAALWRVRRRRGDFDPQIYPPLLVCVLAKIATELSFLWYVDVTGLTHLVGHLFKVAGAWLLLCAVVETGLKRPHALIFGAMRRERALSDEVARHATTLDAVLDATVDPVMMVDPQFRIRFISRAAEEFFGRSAQEVAARTWRQAGLPEALMAPVEDLCRTVLDGGVPATEELGLGATRLEVQASPVVGEGGPGAVVVVLRDVSARKAMEDDLKASLEDKNVLMAEVHHRVKNNLQIVSSILQMQGWRMTDPALRAQFEQACGRILALAKVHELLYAQETLASVDFVQYVRALCADLFRLYGVSDSHIALALPPGSLFLPVGTAEPLALIVHELVSNAVKHAFCERGGSLRIEVALEAGGEGVLVVADDGTRPGRVMAFEGESASLGLRMVGVLVQQLRGRIEVRSQRGVEVEVRFPVASGSHLL